MNDDNGSDPEGGDWYESDREIADRVAREPRPSCTVCLARGIRIDATQVVAAANGVEWYECGRHEPADNLMQVARAKLTPIAEWFASHGLPVPGSRSDGG